MTDGAGGPGAPASAPAFHDAGPADLKPGETALREAGGQQVLLACAADGTLHALGPLCSHAMLGLAGGRVRGQSLVCPHHGARFCLRTGRALGPPAFAPVPAFPARIRLGRVEVWLG